MSYNMMNNATPARKTSKVANTPKKLLQNALQKMGSQVRKVGFRDFLAGSDSLNIVFVDPVILTNIFILIDS